MNNSSKLLIAAAVIGILCLIVCIVHYACIDWVNYNFNSNHVSPFGYAGIVGVILIGASLVINHILSDKQK